jgi:hypothetical protein
MARLSLAELIEQLETALHAAPKGVRALLGPGSAPTLSPPEPHVTQFGEYERVEESKFSPPAAAVPEPEDGELPASYGCTRVVLLVIGAYRVHAYWEVTQEALKTAGPAQAVLRFYMKEQGGWFDVEIDLEARNWYVDLWSADLECRAELGLKASDGRFIRLAASNAVRTPRAWPKAEVQEHFIRVDPPLNSGEAPAPAAATVDAPLSPVPAEPARFAAEPRSSPRAPEVLEKKVTELYAHRVWHPEFPDQPFANPLMRPIRPESIVHREEPARSVSAAPAEMPPPDVTAADEQRFATGVSSPSGQGKHGDS